MMALKQRLGQSAPLFGLFCSTPAALTVELIAAAGYDFTIIDLEHTLIGPDQLAAMLTAARACGVSALVRVAAPYQTMQALDNGAEGVVFPRIRSAQQAQEVVRACHYAPRGERGLNSTWHSAYGREDLAASMDIMTRETLVVAMVEDTEGLAQAEAIAGVDGIDVLMEGAADLSQSLGLPWQTRHPRVRAAVGVIQRAAAARQSLLLPATGQGGFRCRDTGTDQTLHPWRRTRPLPPRHGDPPGPAQAGFRPRRKKLTCVNN